MIDLDLLRTDPDRVRAAILAKKTGDGSEVDALLAADARRRETVGRLQELQEQANAASREIGELFKTGRKDEAASRREVVAQAKADIKALEADERDAEADVRRLLFEIPNLLHPSVPPFNPDGPDGNTVVFEWGDAPEFDFEPKPHWELAHRHGLVDFERGTKVTGAGFPFYIGQGARLQRALIALFLDLAAEAGYTEVQPPLLVNEASALGTGQLPDKEGQMYHAQTDDFFLVPTAEVPLTNLYRDEIFDESDLPRLVAGHTPCFRREAGSYGKEVRGLNRLHQFDKVELVRFVHPDTSYVALDALRDDAERAIQALGLPYRRLLMCESDLGFTPAKKFDLEVWSAGQARWLEVSSVSNFEAYQARRAGIRFRPAGGGKPQPVHTLNGSALALPRIVAALLENGQQADGSVRLPERLARYAGFDRIG
ncbi:MAG TPA: serine--tRNA ligase [Rubricoccaceae bacterium]|jgi:seryl-tRNA synthetase